MKLTKGPIEIELTPEETKRIKDVALLLGSIWSKVRDDERVFAYDGLVWYGGIFGHCSELLKGLSEKYGKD